MHVTIGLYEPEPVIRLSRGVLLSGTIPAADGAPAVNRPVRILRRVDGRWARRGLIHTGREGRFAVPTAAGRLRLVLAGGPDADRGDLADLTLYGGEDRRLGLLLPR